VSKTAVTYYDLDGMPAYRRGNDIMVYTHAGEPRRVTELVKFAHEASEIPKARYLEIKKALLRKG